MTVNNAIEVIVTIKRGGEAKAWALTETGESKGGNYKVFTAKDNVDMPDFAKVYIKAKRETVKAKKS